MKRMGILGPLGTHSEEAAIYLNQKSSEKFELITYSEIFEVLNAVENEEVDCGLVPVENSLEGSINITLDTLARSDNLVVTRELIWTVHNHLMAKSKIDLKSIKEIYSHPQPISQCRNYLRINCPDASIFQTSSTAKAAEVVAQSNEFTAAICTNRAGQLNDLISIASDIQDNSFNRTRFFEVTHRKNISFDNYKDKMLIICQIYGGNSGTLYEVLGEFAIRKVNLTRIESRPARTKLGEYLFFFDLDTDIDSKIIDEAIGAVSKKSIWLKNLGAFEVINDD